MKKFQYNFEADWIVNAMCNFSCDYCDATNEPAGTLQHSIEKYVQFFRARGQWMLHISGGEPLLFLKNVDLMKELTKDGQYISLNTNLSNTMRVRAFTELVDSDFVEYVHVGIHPSERSRIGSWHALLNNLRALKHHKFEVFASVVMTPEMFGRSYEKVRREIAETGVTLIPKALRSDFGMRVEHLKGKNYPHDYTEHERELFLQYSSQAAGERPDLMSGPNTINPLIDARHINGFPNFKEEGVFCTAGKNFFKIDEEGKIWRCERKTQYGDIGLNWLAIDPVALPCRENFCVYYCLKYSDLEHELVL